MTTQHDATANYLRMDEENSTGTDHSFNLSSSAFSFSDTLKKLRPPLPTDENERLTLSPTQKLLKYRRIPAKLILDIILVILLLVMAYLIVNTQKQFTAANGMGFVKYFLPEGYEDASENTQGYYTYYITTISEFLDILRKTLTKSLKFDEISSVTYTTLPTIMYTTLLKQSPRSFLANITSNADIASSDVGTEPLFFFSQETTPEFIVVENSLGGIFNSTGAQQRDVFDRLQEVVIDLNAQTLDTNVINESPYCVNWNIQLIFDNRAHDGRVKFTILYHYNYCERKLDNFSASNSMMWLAIWLVIFTAISIISNVVSIVRRIIIFLKQYKRGGVKWYNLFTPPFLDLWSYLAILKDVFVLIGYSMYLDHDVDMEVMDIITSFFTGLGTLLSFVTVIRHLQYYAEFYTLINALVKALPNVSRFLISITPIFIGFSLSATLWFGHYASFYASFDDSMVTLFSLMQGDMMRENFDMLHGFSKFFTTLGRIFLFAYTIFFIAAVLNIFLLIMADAYEMLCDELKKGGGVSVAIKQINDESNIALNRNTFLSDSRQESIERNDSHDFDIDTQVFLIDSLCDAIIRKLPDEKKEPLSDETLETIAYFREYAVDIVRGKETDKVK